MREKRREPEDDGDEVTALARCLRLAVIALVSAVVTAAAVIAWGGGQRSQENPYYGDLVLISGG